MPGDTALERLHVARLVLLRANIRSLDEYRAATSEQLDAVRRRSPSPSKLATPALWRRCSSTRTC